MAHTVCLLALYYRVVPGAAIVLAANREEYFDRESLPPSRQPDTPRVVCGIDRAAGGTWLGVSEYGLVVTVTNRPHVPAPAQPRSRGLLCRELLRCTSAAEAADLAEAELRTRYYAGANFVVADAATAWVVSRAETVERIAWQPGLHTLSNGDPDDLGEPRQRLLRGLLDSVDSSEVPLTTFIDHLARVFSQPPRDATRDNIVLRSDNGGTVSSTLLALADRREKSIYRYAPAAPDERAYDDYSALLNDILPLPQGEGRGEGKLE